MAASLVHKLLKKPLAPSSPPLRILASLGKAQLSNPTPSPFLDRHPDPIPEPERKREPNQQPFFPSFPHCFALEPISVPCFDRSGGDGGGEGREAVIRADSVKKKRKKKMNKHKLRKLRKRLRRKA